MAVMPGVKQYLEDLCAASSAELLLHRALLQQLEDLTAAKTNGGVAFLKPFMAKMGEVKSLASLCERNQRYSCRSVS